MDIPRHKLTFEQLLNEDTPGILRPSPLTLVDLCGIASKIQQTEGEAPKTLPYPGEFIVDELADLYIDAGKIHARLKDIQNNALISENPTAKETINKIITSLNSVKKLAKLMGKQFDSLSIDKLNAANKIS